MNINRTWAMPNSNTFKCKPIGILVKKYLKEAKVSIDPFARNNEWASYTNDLNPNTKAKSHTYAKLFLETLIANNVKADLIIFDPPYSLRQTKECYEKFGEWKFRDTQNVGRWTDEKMLCDKLLLNNGVFMNFGWNTNGMGKKYQMDIIEILIVAHGSAHNDTLCTVEKRNILI